MTNQDTLFLWYNLKVRYISKATMENISIDNKKEWEIKAWIGAGRDVK